MNLENLDVASNEIVTVEEGAFEETPYIETLILSRNKFKQLNGNIFPREGLRYLRFLYLDNNELMFLPSNFFVKLIILERVTLVGNPWFCLCLDDISRILRKNKIKEECKLEDSGKVLCINDSFENLCSYKYNSDLSNSYLQNMKNVKREIMNSF